MFTRRAFQAVRGSVRQYATEAHIVDAEIKNGGKSFVEHRHHVEQHAAGSAELWRKITLYVACPAIVVGYLNASAMMKEHEMHAEHIKEENGGEVPERVVYHFNKRIKSFPWGDYTLFHNSHANIDPNAGAEE